MGRKPRGYWTRQRLADEAMKYSRRVDFADGSRTAYRIAQRRCLLDDVCAHMDSGRRPDGYWTKERCIAAALPCATIKQFRRVEPNAYLIAHRKGWLDDVTTHMVRLGNRRKRQIYIIASRRRRACYVGLSCDVQRRIQAHASEGTDAVRTILSEPHRVFVSPMMDATDAAMSERALIRKFKARGYEVANAAEGGALGGGVRKWSKDDCASIAEKYEARTAFRINDFRAYDAARRAGWLDDICWHMPKHIRGLNRKHTKRSCADLARRYSQRSDFKRNHSTAYASAREAGWLDEICAHMPADARKLPRSQWSGVKQKDGERNGSA